MKWLARSIVNKMLAISMAGLLVATFLNLLLLLGPLRSVINNFLKTNDTSVAELQQFRESFADIQKEVESTVDKVASENSQVLLADVKKNLNTHLEIYAKQAHEALDQLTGYLLEEQAKGLMVSTDISRIFLRTYMGEIEFSETEDGKVRINQQTQIFKNSGKEFDEFSGIREVERNGSVLLEGVKQIPAHNATIVLQMDVSKIMSIIEEKKKNLMGRMSSVLNAGTSSLSEKLAKFSKQSAVNGAKVESSTTTTVAVIAALNSVLLAVGAILALRYSRQIVRPLLDLVYAAGELANGNFQVPITATTEDEVATLAHCFSRMTESLKESYLNQQKLNSFTRRVSGEEKEGDVLKQLFDAFHDILGFEDIAVIDYTKGERAAGLAAAQVLFRGEDHSIHLMSVGGPETSPTWTHFTSQISGTLEKAFETQGLFRQPLQQEDSCIQLGVMVARDGEKATFAVLAFSRDGKPWNQFVANLFENITISTAMSLQRISNTALNKEVNLAQEVQGLLMHRPNISGRCEVDIVFQQASRGGGDWFYYDEVGANLIFIIADVTGHGVPAALLTSFGRGCVSAMTAFFKADADFSTRMDPSRYLAYLDAIVYSSTKGKIGMTAFALVLNLENGSMQISNGGHNFPYILSKKCFQPKPVSGEKLETSLTAVKKADQHVKPIVLSGNRLGYLPDSKYKTKAYQLSPGDRLFLYTDGLIENINDHGVEFGERRLKDILEKERTGPALKLLKTLESEHLKHVGSVGLYDDVMMACIQLPDEFPASVPLVDPAPSDKPAA